MESYFDYFTHPSIAGIALAFLFTAIWLAFYKPPFLKQPWLWAVLLFSAFFAAACIVYIQTPLQKIITEQFANLWPRQLVQQWLAVIRIPEMLISGLVQEGAKLVAVFFFWWRLGKRMDPKFGIILGAVAGAGLGLLEAQSIHNQVFYILLKSTNEVGLISILLPFIERFFVIAAQIAITALAGYGLSVGRGWQYFLLAALLHAILNISTLFAAQSLLGVELFIAVWSLLITGYILRLRWKKDDTATIE
jgi:RsiW-degrading membrane proteinase PrsW (M82 family)